MILLGEDHVPKFFIVADLVLLQLFGVMAESKSIYRVFLLLFLLGGIEIWKGGIMKWPHFIPDCDNGCYGALEYVKRS